MKGTSGIWVGKHWWYIYLFIYLYFQETNHSLGIWEDIWFRLWGFLLEISWEDYGVSWDISFARTGSMELSRYTYVVSMSYNNNPSNFRTYIYIYMVYISNTHIYIYRITYNIYLLYIYVGKWCRYTGIPSPSMYIYIYTYIPFFELRYPQDPRSDSTKCIMTEKTLSLGSIGSLGCLWADVSLGWKMKVLMGKP